jgi:hypothetical protein
MQVTDYCCGDVIFCFLLSDTKWQGWGFCRDGYGLLRHGSKSIQVLYFLGFYVIVYYHLHFVKSDASHENFTRRRNVFLGHR